MSKSLLQVLSFLVDVWACSIILILFTDFANSSDTCRLTKTSNSLSGQTLSLSFFDVEVNLEITAIRLEFICSNCFHSNYFPIVIVSVRALLVVLWIAWSLMLQLLLFEDSLHLKFSLKLNLFLLVFEHLWHLKTNKSTTKDHDRPHKLTKRLHNTT